MPEHTPYQKAWSLRTLRDVNDGKNDGILMETVFQLQVAAIVQLDERVTKLENPDA